jgi:tRNA-dihydrouridine synthase C
MSATPGEILLAPMEGLADAHMRAVLTGIGGYDRCVTEFVRVSSIPVSAKRLLALCPELATGARTPAGTPVRVQLLGSDPVLMAESAAIVAAHGSFGVDLNFGCPAPSVNRHRGGAALLDEPELLRDIAAAVRAAVPGGFVVSAKMRLGINDADRAIECAQALAAGGVEELVVHARTKVDAYRAPARWEWLGRIREQVAVPVIANGDVCSLADWRTCREISGCSAVMIGRGAVTDPFLASRLRGVQSPDTWAATLPSVLDFWQRIQTNFEADKRAGRLKQWLGMLKHRHPEAAMLFALIREIRRPGPLTEVLERHASDLATPTGLAAA